MVHQGRRAICRRSRCKYRAGPSGIHVFDRTSGLNLLFDEIELVPSLWAAAPRYVSVALTNACDLACPYCYAPKSHAVLDAQILIEWLVELDSNGCLGVGFGGGEPTLFRGFAELCRCVAQETGLAVTFTTHAHHLDKTLIDLLAGNVHFVRVSMDGVGATYEALRGRSFGALRQHLAGLHSLAPFGINYVVNTRTLPDLNCAVSFAAEVGATEFLLLPEQPARGRRGVDGRTLRLLRRWVCAYRGSIPLAVSESGCEGMPACNPLAEETGLRAYAHIDARGVVKRSSYDISGVIVGGDGVLAALNVLRQLEIVRDE
jgi:MoaA/NifB/PqqE/SkfB family radical SAM enzyme